MRSDFPPLLEGWSANSALSRNLDEVFVRVAAFGPYFPDNFLLAQESRGALRLLILVSLEVYMKQLLYLITSYVLVFPEDFLQNPPIQ